MSKAGKKRAKAVKKQANTRMEPGRARRTPSKSRPRKFSTIKKALLSLFVICFCLVVPELLCRVFRLTEKCDADFKFYVRQVDNDIEKEFMREDALLMWSPKPHYVEPGLAINSQGFRDKPLKKSKPHGLFRILCLGDSTTFGFGVPIEAAYHSVLEDRLNRERSNEEISYEVINAGAVGYSSCQGLNMYRYKGVKYKPDIVTFCFGINDAKARMPLSDGDIMQNKVPRFVKVLTNKVLLRSHFFRVFRHYAGGKSATVENEKKVPRVSRDQYREYILELNGLCRANNARLVLITQPLPKVAMSVEPERVGKFYQYMKDLKDIAASENIPLLTVGELTENVSDETSHLFHDLVHPNEAGHALIAEGLHSLLQAQNLLPPENTKN